jgi:molybdate transport system permease protein
MSSIPIDPDTWQSLTLSLKLAGITTICLLLFSAPLAWWLAQSESRVRPIVQAMVNLPLVLPPTVLGFYLLILLGPKGAIGQWTTELGLGHLAFTFSGLVIGSFIFSLPFAVQPIQYAFEAMGKRPWEVAATLRASPLDTFFSVALPQAKSGLIIAGILVFTHTLGEFGVVLMIGGNIEGQTRVISTQIYNFVEGGEVLQAHWLSLFMVGFSFVGLLGLALLRQSIHGVHQNRPLSSQPIHHAN